MSYYEKLLFSSFIFVAGFKQGHDLAWCREHISGKMWKPAISMAFNGIFGRQYEGEA